MQVAFCFACLFALLGVITSSSIPMWEYLTKEEKVRSILFLSRKVRFHVCVSRLQMAYLYSMFKNQVEEYCEFSEMENCVEELTRYGLKRLRELPENHLDEMDPYQRGASSISEYTLFLARESSLIIIIMVYCPKDYSNYRTIIIHVLTKICF